MNHDALWLGETQGGPYKHNDALQNFMSYDHLISNTRNQASRCIRPDPGGIRAAFSLGLPIASQLNTLWD
jgi:hypothetical protein